MSGTLSGTEYTDLFVVPGEFQDILNLTLASGVLLLDDGTLTQDGNFAFGQSAGDIATLAIAPGGVFELVNDTGQYEGNTQIGAYGQGEIVNSGLFEKLGIAQYEDSLIDPSFTNTSSGTLDAAIGLIGLQGGGVLDGTLAGAGAINLGDPANGERYFYTLGASAVVSVATLAAEGDAGLVLAGGSRTFSGALALGGGAALEGGTMVIAGSAVINNFIIADAGTILDAGTIIENSGGLELGQGGTDSGSLTIAAGGVFDAVDDQGDGIGTDGSGPSTLLNEGLFINTSTDHMAVIAMSMTNAATGTIAIIAGGIDAADAYPVASLVNDGLITISNGVLTVGLFYNAIGSIGADPGEAGLIEIGNDGTAAFASTVAANQTIEFTGGDAALLLNRPEYFAAPIVNFGSGDTIDLSGIMANGFSFDAGTDVLALTETVGGNATGVAALTLAGFTDAAALTLLNDSAGGTEIVLQPSGGIFVADGSVTADVWTVSSGDWGDAGNWGAGAPGALDLVRFSSGGGTISYDTSATIDAIADGSGGAFTLDQAGGTLSVLDGGVFAGGVTQALAGELENDGGVLALSGPVSLAGTLAGSGVIALDGYHDLDTLAAGAVLNLASLALYGGAELVLAGDASFAGDFLDGDDGILDLNGDDLTLSGNGSFQDGAANILGAGTIYVTGQTELDINFSGNAAVVDAGAIIQDAPSHGNVAFPSDPGFTNLYIVQGGVYDFVNGSGFVGDILNAGLLEATDIYSGSSSSITENLTNASSGIVSLAAGTSLYATGTSSIAGTVTGAGTMVFGTVTIDPSALITAQNLIFEGPFYLNNNSYSFGQNVQLFYGSIYGTGTLGLTGASVIGGYNIGDAIYDGAVLIDSGFMLDEAALNIQGYVTSNGSFYAASELSIARGAVFNMVDAFGISGAGVIVNDGLFELSAGIGVLPVQPGFTNASSGTIDVLNGTLDFAGGGIFAGTLEGPGAIAFTGGLVTLAQGVALDAAIAFNGATITGAPVVTIGGTAEIGDLTLAAGTSLVVAGTLDAQAFADYHGNTISGAGTGVLEFSGAGGAFTGIGTEFTDFARIGFSPGAAWVVEGNAAGLGDGVAIDGFGLDDSLILDGFSFAGASYVSGAGIELSNGTAMETLALQGSIALDDFLITTDGTNTTLTETIVTAPVAAAGAALTVAAGVNVQSPTIAGGTLILASGASVTGNISLTGTGGTLVIEPDDEGATSIPANSITGFTIGDTIELAGVSFTSFGSSFGAAGEDTDTVATAGTLSIDADGTFYNLLIAGATVGERNFVLDGDLAITEIACFAAGTWIATASGAAKVEDLAIGDLVKTMHAGLQQIKWIGQRGYDGRFIAGNQDVLPIRIKAHAIAQNVPARDLFVSPGHALCVEGALIQARRLVNGVSITQAAQVEQVTYYHIETAAHEIIFAENCPAETFMDEHFRAQFRNAAQFQLLYPGEHAAGTACLARLEDGLLLQAIQRRLNARAGMAPLAHLPGPLRGYVDAAGADVCTGWAQDVRHPEAPVWLDMLMDGKRVARVLANLYRADLRQAGLGSGCHAFRAALPPKLTGRLEVRRAADGAELPWTKAALAA